MPWLCEAQHDAEIHEATECSSNTAGGVEIQGRGRAAAARSELPASLPSARSRGTAAYKATGKAPPPSRDTAAATHRSLPIAHQPVDEPHGATRTERHAESVCATDISRRTVGNEVVFPP